MEASPGSKRLPVDKPIKRNFEISFVEKIENSITPLKIIKSKSLIRTERSIANSSEYISLRKQSPRGIESHEASQAEIALDATF